MSSLVDNVNNEEYKHVEQDGSGDDDDGVENQILCRAGSKRGRKKLPFVWSKVIHVKPDTSSDIRQYDIETELSMQETWR